MHCSRYEQNDSLLVTKKISAVSILMHLLGWFQLQGIYFSYPWNGLMPSLSAFFFPFFFRRWHIFYRRLPFKLIFFYILWDILGCRATSTPVPRKWEWDFHPGLWIPITPLPGPRCMYHLIPKNFRVLLSRKRGTCRVGTTIK